MDNGYDESVDSLEFTVGNPSQEVLEVDQDILL